MRSRLLLLALLAGGSAAEPAAAAFWSEPVSVPGSTEGVLNRVAIARDGTVAVGWDPAIVAIRRPGGSWKLRRLAPASSSAQSTDIAFDPAGRLLVTWTHAPTPPGKALGGPYQVRAVTWTRRSGWGGVRVLGRSGHFRLAHPTITMNTTGDALIAWRGFRRAGRRVVEAVSTSFRPACGRFGREQQVRDGVDNAEHILPRTYHRLLVWDIVQRPLVTRLADRVMSRVLGKSIVLYARRTNVAVPRPGSVGSSDVAA